MPAGVLVLILVICFLIVLAIFLNCFRQRPNTSETPGLFAAEMISAAICLFILVLAVGVMAAPETETVTEEPISVVDGRTYDTLGSYSYVVYKSDDDGSTEPRKVPYNQFDGFVSGTERKLITTKKEKHFILSAVETSYQIMLKEN